MMLGVKREMDQGNEPRSNIDMKAAMKKMETEKSGV